MPTPVRVATWSTLADRGEYLGLYQEVELSARRLERWFEATVELMQVMARACGHDHLSGFELRDLTAWKRDVAKLSGVRYAGVR